MAQKLTDTALKSFKPKDKLYKVTDGSVSGLHVAVSPAGRRAFRLAFRFQGKERLLSLGTYPEMSLAEAREAAMSARKQLAQGLNPAALKREAKAKVKADSVTFETVARQWLEIKKPEWSPGRFLDMTQKLERHVLPRIGNAPITGDHKNDVQTVLDGLQAAKKYETRKKVWGLISNILQYAIDIEVQGAETFCTSGFKRRYSAPASKHRAALTRPEDIAGLMKAITSYEEVNVMTSLALKFSALTFARPGEIRKAEWAEIDLKDTLWRIPAEKMKMRQPHLVPLARQAVALLERLRPISGHTRFLFPNTRTKDTGMSEATVLVALRNLGYTKEQMSAHGFRGMASTILNEKGFSPDWIERQLAHGEGNKVRAAYNHADFLDDRRTMMQWWADYLDQLSGEGAHV